MCVMYIALDDGPGTKTQAYCIVSFYTFNAYLESRITLRYMAVPGHT